MRRQLVSSLFLASLAVVMAPSLGVAQDSPPCGSRSGQPCGGVTADPLQGEFHGLIAVKGRPDVLATAAHSGTTAGCGDCVWTLVMMCVTNTPGDPHNQQSCTG